jgi:hypothetical protein
MLKFQKLFSAHLQFMKSKLILLIRTLLHRSVVNSAELLQTFCILMPSLTLKWQSFLSETMKYSIYKCAMKWLALSLITDPSNSMPINFPGKTIRTVQIPNPHSLCCMCVSVTGRPSYITSAHTLSLFFKMCEQC